MSDIAVDAAGHVAIVGGVGGPTDGGTSSAGALVASFDSATGSSR